MSSESEKNVSRRRAIGMGAAAVAGLVVGGAAGYMAGGAGAAGGPQTVTATNTVTATQTVTASGTATKSMVTEPQKVVLLFQEALSLSSWGQGGAQGVERVKAAWPNLQAQNGWPPLDAFDTAENVAMADIERTVTQYHDRGYRIFISYVGGWGSSINAIAPKFPDSHFFINYEEFNQPNSEPT
jgi:basic membrane lipoprotein Med (substrate-binding protein (PBP1-ABC) superfamily)